VKQYEVGDHVVYRKHKASPCPGPRARDVRPSSCGEDYTYLVNKFWIVSAVPDGETVEVMTRTGKVHYLRADDPNLRGATVLEELLFRERFPQLTRGMAPAKT